MRGLRAAFLVVFAVGAVGVAASPAAAAPQYPDLRMYSPTDVQLTTEDVDGSAHQFLRFTLRLVDLGSGAFEVQRSPMTSGTAELKQRIYESPVGFHDEHLTSVPFDPLDFNFAIPDLARYELWTARGYARAKARDFRRATPLYARDNLGFCVSDGERETDAAVAEPVYWTCTKLVSGISAGWADVEQWTQNGFDFGSTLPPDGDYVIRATVDPHNLLFESPGKADPERESETANSAVTHIRLVGGHLAGVEVFA